MRKWNASLWLCLALGVSGCQHLPPVTGDTRDGGHRTCACPAGTAHGAMDNTWSVAGYAERLSQMDDAELEKALKHARNHWQQHPGPMARARLGLVRGQWGYAGYDPTAAREHLLAALAAPTAGWSESERAFLNLRARQLQRQTRLRDRRQALAAENHHLQQQLDKARKKLEAITEIEQKLGNSGSRP